ncbi:MAG: segregation and condensation protein A [Chloroflexota bacterium]
MPAPTRQIPDYHIELPAFNGPLDLLLHLIEREELDITVISLARVTEQYLAQVEKLKEERIEDLIDFLVIGARLVLIKSRALLPQSPVTAIDEEEEDPAEALLRQLRFYKQFKSASSWLHERNVAGLRTYLRVAPPPQLESKLDLSGVDSETLRQALAAVLLRAESQEESVEVVQPRRITIDGRISQLRAILRVEGWTAFGTLLSTNATREEVAVTLLAILELIKRHEATAHQPHLFGPIEIHATAEEATQLPADPALHQGDQ